MYGHVEDPLKNNNHDTAIINGPLSLQRESRQLLVSYNIERFGPEHFNKAAIVSWSIENPFNNN